MGHGKGGLICNSNLSADINMTKCEEIRPSIRLNSSPYLDIIGFSVDHKKVNKRVSDHLPLIAELEYQFI